MKPKNNKTLNQQGYTAKPTPKPQPQNKAEEWARFKLRYNENRPKTALSTVLLKLCEKSPKLREQVETAMGAKSLATFTLELFKKLSNDPSNTNSPLAQMIAGVKGAEIDEATTKKVEVAATEVLQKAAEHKVSPAATPQPKPAHRNHVEPGHKQKWREQGEKAANTAKVAPKPQTEQTLEKHHILPSFMSTKPPISGNGDQDE